MQSLGPGDHTVTGCLTQLPSPLSPQTWPRAAPGRRGRRSFRTWDWTLPDLCWDLPEVANMSEPSYLRWFTKYTCIKTLTTAGSRGRVCACLSAALLCTHFGSFSQKQLKGRTPTCDPRKTTESRAAWGSLCPPLTPPGPREAQRF